MRDSILNDLVLEIDELLLLASDPAQQRAVGSFLLIRLAFHIPLPSSLVHITPAPIFLNSIWYVITG